MIGSELEHSGWRQGVILKGEDAEKLLNGVRDFDIENEIVLIASQSCDIANNNVKIDPVIEVSIGRIIQELNGNYADNKNPRLLHTSFSSIEVDGVVSEICIEIRACEKLLLEKVQLRGLEPDNTRVMSGRNINGYVAWLSARYSRPALPTEFNNRISKADKRSKAKKAAKKLNIHLSGIYVEIAPEADIPQHEQYKVNLLGVVSPDYDGDIDEVVKSLNPIAEVMRDANMDVAVVVKKESEISVTVIKRFKRFYYDDLSIKNDEAPMPVETGNIL